MLAPSKEALDTPLSPRPLNHEPGSATGLSDDYPHGTHTRRLSPAFRTQHDRSLGCQLSRLSGTTAKPASGDNTSADDTTVSTYSGESFTPLPLSVRE